MTAPDLYSENVRHALRADVSNVLIGVLLGIFALAALAGYFMRRRAGSALLWFGLFTGGFSVRLLAQTAVVPFLADPLDRAFWPYLCDALTYVLPIPGNVFFRTVFPAWARSLGWMLWIQLAFGAAGLISDQVLRQPGSLHIANNILVLLTWCALIYTVFFLGRHDPGLKTIRGGLAVFGVSVLLANLSGLGVLKIPFDFEPFGLAVFLSSLAVLIAVRTLGNEERLAALDQELDIARKIQASILPQRLPQMPRLRLATRYLAMTAVAGDFYDFLPVDASRAGILIADVSGHGVPAALIASMVKIAIAAQLPHAGDPARVLDGMNQILAGKLKGQFVTAAYLYLDLESDVMRYSTAGHPPLLWRHAGGTEADEADLKGLALGLRARARYENLECPIAAGDRFLLYTDGLFEARNAAGDFFGAQRLRDLVAGSRTPDPEAFATEITAALSAWIGPGAAREDDLTLIVADVS